MTITRNSPEMKALFADLAEAQIQQMLDGLRRSPMLLPRLKDMASRGDEVAAEVVKRFEAE